MSPESIDVDLIDQVVGIAPGDPLDTIRRARPVARDQVQAAEQALFETDTNDIPRDQRWLVGAFVTALTVPGTPLDEHRRAGLDPDRAVLLEQLLSSAPDQGPRGSYREPGLATESQPVERWLVPDDVRAQLGEPLAAVVEHAHLLVIHPRDSRPAVLGRLVEAGWTRQQVVTWSQLVAFTSFQTRVVTGLTALKQNPGTEQAA
ncbi:CMD domain protein [Aestuariimicrobium ganziense]|uniref:CMD domain protein n=1 Tax=Aestuariimicrobium ganziense TaxID=2773677 RepID=UPI0019440B20|nr:CMD domain protein [Aestuariimicrobium ganziense]